MALSPTLVVPVMEASGAAEARRVATGLANRLGFDEHDTGRVAIVASEAATNLAKHAGGGDVLVTAVQADGTAAVEILVLDRGPGIADVGRSLLDGYSTAGSPGTGLGAMRRLSREFDIWSASGVGTAILARVWAGAPTVPAGRPGVEVAGLSVMKSGEEECGDAWAVAEDPNGVAILAADGLGHGPDAARAAREAVRLFTERHGLAPAPMLERLHAGLRSTRGAAVGVAALDLRRRLVRFAGVGNVSGTIVGGGGTRSLVSHNGTVGHEIRRIQEFEYPWPEAGLLVIHTDGLGTHWNLDAYPGLTARHPALIAGVLYRDFKRRHDDVTVVVAKEADR